MTKPNLNDDPYISGSTLWGDFWVWLKAKIQAIIDNYSEIGHAHTEADITDLGDYSLSTHNHDTDYSDIVHNHDTVYEPKDTDIQTHINATTGTPHGDAYYHPGNLINVSQLINDAGYLTETAESQTLSWDDTSGQISISNGNSIDIDGRYLALTDTRITNWQNTYYWFNQYTNGPYTINSHSVQFDVTDLTATDYGLLADGLSMTINTDGSVGYPSTYGSGIFVWRSIFNDYAKGNWGLWKGNTANNHDVYVGAQAGINHSDGFTWKKLLHEDSLTKDMIDVLNVDSDTLDGQHGSYYQSASNLISGTLSASRLSSSPRYYTLDPVIPATNVASRHLSTPTIAEVAIEKAYLSNKLQFHLPDSIEVYETDTWVAHSQTPNDIKGFVSGRYGNGGTITIPYGTEKLRMTWTNQYYCSLNYFYMYFSGDGHNFTITIEKSVGTSSTNWTEVLTSNLINGWPSHVSLPHSPIWWNLTNESQSKYIRITITPTWNETYSEPPYNKMSLYNMNWYGSYPANMQNAVWYWDSDKNATFRGGLHVDGNITTYSTIDGRDIASDGAKLDALVSDKNYEHVQATPSSVWNIPHNLGKRPAVSVLDSAGTEVTGQVDYIDINNVTITFQAAFSGSAILN